MVKTFFNSNKTIALIANFTSVVDVGYEMIAEVFFFIFMLIAARGIVCIVLSVVRMIRLFLLVLFLMFSLYIV